ncbi:hypothetical protein Vadar_017889 [Vaccinium darrowii]|uniref:Uncharacterized protein n=1 Tax=Vaccinium darrowii TaxID=229202 RepID=A0ACB7YXE0_9ERIC|nr:hypothetical protein Vadar_017889 [Vaccinium darrowii]
MTSLSKHVYTGDGEDKISSLPEALLLHILSLMPTHYAVRTSILSLRWKDLWALVPSLDFEWMSSNTVDNNDLSFVNFVDHVLLHKLTSIERISFYVRGPDSEVVASCLHEWLRVAIRCHVQVIYIQMCPFPPLSLPSELFTCKTLTRLQLARELEFDTPLSSVWLPNLRDLQGLDFADDNKLPLFPNLIRLNLIVPDDYSWRLLPDLLCSAPNLATLVLWKCVEKGVNRLFPFNSRGKEQLPGEGSTVPKGFKDLPN